MLGMFVFNALLCYMFLCTKVGPVELPEWMGVPEEPPADPTLTIIFGAVIFTWSAPYMPRERSTHTNHAHKPRTQTSHTGLINRHAQDHAARAHTHTHTHTQQVVLAVRARHFQLHIPALCAPLSAGPRCYAPATSTQGTRENVRTARGRAQFFFFFLVVGFC